MAKEDVVDDKTLDAEMDESIRSTLHDIQSRAEEPVVETLEPVKSEKPRDETGKFTKAPKEKIIEESAAPAEKPDTTPIVGATEQVAVDASAVVETPAIPAIDINRPPSSWKPAAKAAWSALPEPVRAEIYRREGDFHNGYKGIKENADFGQSVKGIIDPYRMLIEAEGGTPEKAIADTMKTAALFRIGTPQQKLNALFQLDQQFCGGAMNQQFMQRLQEEVAKATGQPVQPSPAPPYQDPRVDQILGSLKTQERDRAAQAERVSNKAVEYFIAAKDEKGEALHPFVDNVLDDMSIRVAELRRQNPAMEHAEALKQAYEAAIWANPETRAVLLSQQQAQASQPAETLRKVEQAKRASAVNVPKRGALPATGPAQTLDETIRETGKALGMF